MEYKEVRTGDIPGLIVNDNGAFYKLSGKCFPVIGLLRDEKRGLVPLLDIPQMEELPRRRAAV